MEYYYLARLLRHIFIRQLKGLFLCKYEMSLTYNLIMILLRACKIKWPHICKALCVEKQKKYDLGLTLIKHQVAVAYIL